MKKISDNLVEDARKYYERWGNLRKVADFFGVDRTTLGYRLGMFKLNRTRREKGTPTIKPDGYFEVKSYADYLADCFKNDKEYKRQKQLEFIKSKIKKCGQKDIEK